MADAKYVVRNAEGEYLGYCGYSLEGAEYGWGTYSPRDCLLSFETASQFASRFGGRVEPSPESPMSKTYVTEIVNGGTLVRKAPAPPRCLCKMPDIAEHKLTPGDSWTCGLCSAVWMVQTYPNGTDPRGLDSDSVGYCWRKPGRREDGMNLNSSWTK